MDELRDVAPAFVEMAHRIVWCSAATVDGEGRPRSRILHPLWSWDGTQLTGVIATDPTSTKREHLDRTPFLSCNYWLPDHDTCVAECRTEWLLDEESRATTWQRFVDAPAPVGYDPSIIPGWDTPDSPTFGVLRLEPWRLRVMPGAVLLTGGAEGRVLTWHE
jgi:hypothetical protein